jgi:hypothetical protein
MVGRTKDGEPLAAAGEQATNEFTYRDDPRGLRCPLGAHIRRANPRNADLPPGGRGLLSRLWRMLGFNSAALEQDLIASTRFHRLLRRGRKYGDDAARAAAATGSSPGAETGIHFICLAANIKRQIQGQQPEPWKYFDKGSMATIGRYKAVANVAGLKFGGLMAWLAWLFVHILFLISFRNRVFVFWHWTWAHANYAKGARLITGSTKEGVLKEV